MGIRYIIGDLVTGRRIVTLPVISGNWADDIDLAETVSATVKLNNDVARTLDLKNAATVGKTFLAAIDTGPFGESGKILAAGPLWSVNYDRTAQTLELSARGIRSIFDHRYILPPSALTADVTSWTIPDPADPAGIGRIPNPVLATTYTDLSWGGMAVSLVAQTLSWPGGALPIVLPSVEAGTSTKTYDAIDFKTVGAALTDLTRLEGGPEITFTPRPTTDGQGVEWAMTVGTTAEPLIYSENVTAWNVTTAESPVKSLTVDIDGSSIAALSWATGGRQDDVALVSRAYDPATVTAGWPLMETLDPSHLDVVVQATLDNYAAANLTSTASPVEVWAFVVKAHPLDRYRQAGGPQLDDYNVGDFIRLHFDPYDNVTHRGDLYLPGGGDVGLRIVGLSGDHLGDDVTIKCAPEVS